MISRRIILACACAILAIPGVAWSLGAATVGQDEGYSGAVLDKILSKWTPLPVRKGNHRTRVVLDVDEEGRLIKCRPAGSSAQDLAQAACAAASAAAPFGTPPYGMPAALYFSFWTGDAGSSARTDGKPANKVAGSAQGATPHKQSGEEVTEKTPASAPAGGEAEGIDQGKLERYLSRITWSLRNSMYVPAQAAPGTYHATVRIHCDRAGKILSSSLVKGSGSGIVDRYVMQGIKRAGSVAAPPAGAPDAFDLDFTLVRK